MRPLGGIVNAYGAVKMAIELLHDHGVGLPTGR